MIEGATYWHWTNNSSSIAWDVDSKAVERMLGLLSGKPPGFWKSAWYAIRSRALTLANFVRKIGPIVLRTGLDPHEVWEFGWGVLAILVYGGKVAMFRWYDDWHLYIRFNAIPPRKESGKLPCDFTVSYEVST